METLTTNVDWLSDAARLRAFVAVIEQGGFTRAAQALGVTQPTVSTLVASLEKRLGTPLLERARSGAQPTAAGTAFLPFCRRILETAEQAGRSVIAAVSEASHHLTIAGGEGLVIYALPPALALLSQRRPQLEITVTSVDLDRAIGDLRDGQVDCVLATRDVTPSDLTFRAVQWDPLVLIAPPNHPLAADVATIADLAHVPLVTREAGRADRMAIDALLREARIEPPRRTVVASLEGVKQAVMAGLGLALVPALAVRGNLASGRLVTVAIDAEMPSVEWGLVTARREASPVVDQLLWALAESARSAVPNGHATPPKEV